MAKAVPPAIVVPFTTLRGLLGKPVDDPAVQAMIAKAGKVTVKPDFVIAKEAGFDFSLARPDGAKKKVLSTLFLFPEGSDKHRGYPDLPTGFTFTTRADLLANLPAPASTWKIGKGDVPVATQDVDHDCWLRDGLELLASYRDDEVRSVQVSLAPEVESRDLSIHPLHFEAKPTDAPADAALTGMALLVAWAADRFGLPAKHAGNPLAKRTITPRAFLIAACGKKLTSLDVDPKLENFLWGYTHRMFLKAPARAKPDAAIVKLLRLGRKPTDERAYADDYLATFSDLESPFYVPDSWTAVDRIAPVLDARWADYQATEFERAPDVKLYEKAAKLRDAVAIAPDRAAAAPSATADDALATDLVALIDRPLKDPAVKAVLGRAGLPIGKKVDQQANPALGVSYMATNQTIAGKKQLVVDSVRFHAAKQTARIRSLSGEVQFGGFPGKLPHGLALGASRAAVTKLLGPPASSYDDDDHFLPAKQRRITCTFAKDKLVRVYAGKPFDT